MSKTVFHIPNEMCRELGRDVYLQVGAIVDFKDKDGDDVEYTVKGCGYNIEKDYYYYFLE